MLSSTLGGNKTQYSVLIVMGEISPKYHVSVVMETKEGIEMSKGKNIQKDQHVSPKFLYLPILIDETEGENIFCYWHFFDKILMKKIDVSFNQIESKLTSPYFLRS